MSRKEETLTYKQNMSKTEVFHVIKAIGCPLIVFGLGIFTISNFCKFWHETDLSGSRDYVVPWIFCCSFDAISAKRSFKSDINYLHCLFLHLTRI